jgi:hypothetical protein
VWNGARDRRAICLDTLRTGVCCSTCEVCTYVAGCGVCACISASVGLSQWLAEREAQPQRTAQQKQRAAHAHSTRGREEDKGKRHPCFLRCCPYALLCLASACPVRCSLAHWVSVCHGF